MAIDRKDKTKDRQRTRMTLRHRTTHSHNSEPKPAQDAPQTPAKPLLTLSEVITLPKGAKSFIHASRQFIRKGEGSRRIGAVRKLYYNIWTTACDDCGQDIKTEIDQKAEAVKERDLVTDCPNCAGRIKRNYDRAAELVWSDESLSACQAGRVRCNRRDRLITVNNGHA